MSVEMRRGWPILHHMRDPEILQVTTFGKITLQNFREVFLLKSFAKIYFRKIMAIFDRNAF